MEGLYHVKVSKLDFLGFTCYVTWIAEVEIKSIAGKW